MRELENLTVGSMLEHVCKQYPDRTAVVCRDIKYTYTKLNEVSARFASALIARGIEHGDHVGIFGEISFETISLFLAIQRIGAVAVMINTSLESDDLETAMQISDVKTLCIGDSYVKGHSLSSICSTLSPLPCLREIYVYDNEPDNHFPYLIIEKTPDMEAVKARENAVKPEDTAVILFTSGSTGVPKAVMTSHFSRVNSGIQQGEDFETTCEDVFCISIPMFHCFCISANIMAALTHGACICIPKDRHTASILTAIQTYRCTILHSVPSMFRAVLARPDFKTWDLSSLRTGIIGGSGYPPEDFGRIEKSFGMTLLSSLGQTEATAGLTIGRACDSAEKRLYTVGHFMDHIEGKIADIKTGEALPDGEVGEICIKGYLVMQGFYKQPEVTAAAIDKDGFLHTGDLGMIDEDGYVVMKGRIKELIIRGGENISPGEIETELACFPEVSVSKVIGIPDRHYGEEVCACIVLTKGAELTEERIRESLKGKLAAYKIPKYILFFDRFPLNATGKIRVKDVTAEAKTRLGIDE